MLRPGPAKDQYGDSWFIASQSGSQWAIGVLDGGIITRLVGPDDTIHTDLSMSRGIRKLRQGDNA